MLPLHQPFQVAQQTSIAIQIDIGNDCQKQVEHDGSSQGQSTPAARDRPQKTKNTGTTARSTPKTGNDVIYKSAVIELLCAILERMRSIPLTPSKPASKGERLYPIWSDDDSDDECSFTIDQSRTNRNVNDRGDGSQAVQRFAVRTEDKDQEYSSSLSTSVNYDVTSGLKRTNQS